MKYAKNPKYCVTSNVILFYELMWASRFITLRFISHVYDLLVRLTVPSMMSLGFYFTAYLNQLFIEPLMMCTYVCTLCNIYKDAWSDRVWVVSGFIFLLINTSATLSRPPTYQIYTFGNGLKIYHMIL